MKVKAVIMRPDRTNDVIIVPKRKQEGKTFRHQGATYFLHPDRFQVTWVRKFFGLIKFYYSTYYFTMGISNPLPVPAFTSLIKNKSPLREIEIEEEIGSNGTTQTVKKKLKVDGTTAEFRDVVDLGVSAEELAAIFNPWFYRIIAPVSKLKEEIQFWVLVALCAGVGYIIYMLHSGKIKVVVDIASGGATGGG